MSEAANGPGWDPLELSDGIGIACIPLPGFFSDAPELQIANLRVQRIEVMSWRLMENNRAVDLYSYHYQALPRYYLVRSLYREDEEGSEAEMGQALQDAEDLVLALRLLSNEDLIAPEHVVPYKRVHGSNVRPVPDLGRSRFLVTTFGEPITFMSGDVFSDRRWEEELVSLGGSLFGLAAADIPVVEERLDLVRRHRQAAPDEALDWAVRNFSVGRSRLVGQGQRPLALFTALETLFGGFRKKGKRPSLGDLVGAVMDFSSEEDTRAWAEAFEETIRPARNQIAHGAVPGETEDWEMVWGALTTSVRGSLALAFRLAVLEPEPRKRLASLPNFPEGEGPNAIGALRYLVDRAYRQKQDAVSFIADLQK